MLDFSDIEQAAARLQGVANVTPVLTSRTLDELLGAELFLKAELFQRGGSFKFRGAYNKISQLTDGNGVVAYSSGNHAQAVALVSKIRGLPAAIVMPSDAPAAKVDAVMGYGAEVVSYDPATENRFDIAHELARERSAHIVPPYDDWNVMAGAGTTALELMQTTGPLDLLVVCIGGGGLIAGCATAALGMNPGIRVVGVEPLDANDTALSLAAGERVTIDRPRTEADGLRVETPGELTFEVNRRLLDSIVTVTEDDIFNAMAFYFERMSLVVEPSGAVPLAALLAGHIDVTGERVGVLISGGNIGIERFTRLVTSPWQQ